MILPVALIYSLVSLYTAQAAPASDFNTACEDVTYTVETVEYKNGTQFLSSETCKNQDTSTICEFGPVAYRWTAIPLASENLKGAVYNLSQIADAANAKLGSSTSTSLTASAQLNSDIVSGSHNCTGVLECGLLVKAEYVDITGTRSFDPSCKAPKPSEPFKISLPKLQYVPGPTNEPKARFHHIPCYRGPAPTDPNIKMDACPSTEPWTEQIIPFDNEGGKTIPGPFAKLIGMAPHGAGDRYRIRFNSDNPNFGVRGQKLLEALNKDVYEAGVATAHAHNWQEGPDGFSDIAEFDFDPEQGERSNSRDAVCRKVALVAESVSKLGGLTSKG
ncbi:MAG: hypothetical protein Q9226_007833, partial [Calogaya cf. arnoldii]